MPKVLPELYPLPPYAASRTRNPFAWYWLRVATSSLRRCILRVVYRVFPAGLSALGSGLVTAGPPEAPPNDLRANPETSAKLVVLEWEIYFRSRAVAKPGIALAWGALARRPCQIV